MKRIHLAVSLAFGLVSGAFAQVTVPSEKAISQVNGVLWTQQSLEHRAGAAMAYQAATDVLPRLIRSKAWASLEHGPAKSRRPAVILDIDETVLDNSAYNAWAVQNNQSFEPKSWTAWIALEAAGAVPGAASFTQQAAKLGVDVFYVTNRECTLDETDPCPALTYTQANLARLGFTRSNDRAAFMFKKPCPEWNTTTRPHGARRLPRRIASSCWWGMTWAISSLSRVSSACAGERQMNRPGQCWRISARICS